ncbi:MAG: PKD domain-containing protein, partial [Bacteroidota bacterium]
MRSFYPLSLLLLLVCGFPNHLLAQEQLPSDSLCVPYGQGVIADLLPDSFPVGEYFTNFLERECFVLGENGVLTFSRNGSEELCCGESFGFFLEIFRNGSAGQPELVAVQEITLTIKCPKPDCGIVDLTEFRPQDPTMGDEPGQFPPDCIQACENSTSIYLFPEDPNLVYGWTAINGTVTDDPGLPGQISVAWGDVAGGASLSVEVYATDGVTLLDTRTWCVELTPSPVADFTFNNVACLDQEVYFTNTSSGAAATYDWDFGDGNTAQNVANPSHAYDTPGTFTVTLYATSDGVLPDGSQACCCTDSISYDITIDPLPGPQIYWISTLCEGDESQYWTDATGCDMYNWSVSANGTITAGLGTDTITVAWGVGPSGTITLEVVNCDDDYCDEPSTAIVPIISVNGQISGPTEVCGGESANYELPKWTTVEYDWGAAAGTINGPSNGHVVNVTLPTTPGTYELTVNYGSDFLNGLPNHEGDDCYGSDILMVTVLGNFDLFATPNPACVDQFVTVFGVSDIGSPTYDWSVAGYPGLDITAATFSLSPGDVPGPGVYTIMATVTNPGDYCVATQVINVVLKEAITPVILGPADYCVGEPVVYTIASPAPGYAYNWQITPLGAGTVDLGQGSPTATVTFNVTSGVTLSVVGIDGGSPGCVSDPVSVFPTTKELVPTDVIGPEACTNSLADYTIADAQHPDATYTWAIFPDSVGSIVSGNGTPMVSVQWNNDPVPATVSLTIELCGLTLEPELDLVLNDPLEPEIFQTVELCPGGTTFLYVADSTDFDTISWTLPQGVTGPTTGGFTTGDPGDYVVNTIDANGCPGVARYRLEEGDGPEVDLLLSGLSAICVNNPDYPPFPTNPTITADTDAGNTIEWFCNGVSQGAAALGNNTFVHVWNDTVKTYSYVAEVVDTNGCTETSDPLLIFQRRCCDTPFVTDPFPMQYAFSTVRQDPNCDIVDLAASFSGDSVACHGFNLPLFTQVISFGGDDDSDSMRIRLPGVGCYNLVHEIGNWSFDYDTITVADPVLGQRDSIFKADSIKCFIGLTEQVCNPLLAEFDYDELCGVVTFEDLSKIDTDLTNGGLNYDWVFDDGDTGSGFPISHEYENNGTYNVILTLSDDDCQSVFTLAVVVDDIPDSDFTFAPATVCEGEPITFTGTGSNVIEWEWDFDDDATFNGNGPQRTFMTIGGVATDYDVELITTNSAGCMDTVVYTVTVYPAPEDDTIDASDGLIICEGSSTTLSVDNVATYTYAWSTGATTNAIVVDEAGTYDVTITTTDGCERVIDAVEVQVVPLPDNSWKGNPYICDNGSTTLMSLAGASHTYEWTNLTNPGLIGTAPSYTVSYSGGALVQQIQLKVTSIDYGCVADTIIEVERFESPAPVVDVAGGLCEGDGSTIFVTNPEADVVYTWNTGETGTSIFTYQAGTYTVVATHVESGCTGTDFAIINPLPDICSVPTGCYETCAPDTICAPAGPYGYAWFQNGDLVGTGQKLEVFETASYSVTVFDTITGCFASSDSLYLEVIDCDSTECDGIITELKDYTDADGNAHGCCSELIIGNLPPGIFAIEITSPDAELDYLPGTVNPIFGYDDNLDMSTIQLAGDFLLTTELPSGAPAASAVVFCPDEYTVSPQTIIVNYLDADQMVVCSDTLQTECEVEPPCIYVTQDTLTCAMDDSLLLTFEVCVPLDADFNVGYLELRDESAAAVIDLPTGFDVIPAMVPGECRTFSLTLSPLPAGVDFCYSVVAHDVDPALNPAALCCSSVEEYCLVVPDCDPCDNLKFDVVDQEGCCYDLYLVDGEPNFDFDAVDLCLLNSDATLEVYNAL